MDMEIDIDDLLDFYGHSTTTPSSDDGGNWVPCSPLVDWDSFTAAAGHDDFHHIIDSFMDYTLPAGDLTPEEESIGERSATTTEEEDDEATAADHSGKGLRLVHLLMAAAEALTGANKSHDLARAILIRLKELVSHTANTNMERLAAYFTDALQGLLDGAAGAHNLNKNSVVAGPHREDPQTDMLAAFQLLQDMSPYIKFAHFTANQAILEAVAHERRVHIIDYDVSEGAQWASLIQALPSRKDGPSGPHLRITALSRSCGRGGGRRSIATVQETGRRLTVFAASVGQPFSFHQCRLDPDETFRTSSLKLVRGEALVFNCVLHLPHLNYRAPDSIASFLSGARELSPKLVTLAEEEVGPVGDAGFVGLFMDSLHRYSAMCDSLEAGFPMQRWARGLVERVFLGPRITSSVARLYRTGEEDEEGSGSWGEWLVASGFRGVPISFTNHCQAKLLLGLFNDGYRVEELSNNKLVLSWKSRRLLSASVWTSSDDSNL